MLAFILGTDDALVDDEEMEFDETTELEAEIILGACLGSMDDASG